MPEHEPQPYEACAVCGRTLLRGERVAEYVTPEGGRAPVCALCRQRAEDWGWIPADQAGAVGASDPARRRRRGLGGLDLRRRAGELAERVRAKPPEPPAESAPPETTPEERPPVEPPPPPPPRPEPETPEQRMRRAITRFNDSGTPRVVAGLTRSLGTPRAAIKQLSDPQRLEITIAWELSWYRWEVATANGDESPREVGKGAEVEELADEGIEWNAAVDGDGRIRWRESS